MNDNVFQWIIETLVERGIDAVEDHEGSPKSEFKEGYACAYHHVLDIIQSRLDIYDYDLSEYGINMDLDEIFINAPARRKKEKQQAS